MVPRMRTVSSAADAGDAMQIRARLRAAKVRGVVPDIVNPPWIFELTADSFVIHRRPISQILVEEAGDFLLFSLFLDASKSTAAGFTHYGRPSATPALREYSCKPATNFRPRPTPAGAPAIRP